MNFMLAKMTPAMCPPPQCAINVYKQRSLSRQLKGFSVQRRRRRIDITR